jgi:hypothetical protein
MIVYGDQIETVDASTGLADLTARWSRLRAMPPGLERHAALVNLHIEAGRIAQGLADRRFDPGLGDRPDAVDHAWMAWLTQSAAALIQSWRNGFDASLPPPPPALATGSLRLRLPEGFAFYGLYPESYATAAQRLGWRGAGVRVIGLRSIGASLAPMVAAALEAPPPVTIRPFGPAFGRRARLCDDATRRWLDGAQAFVVVDEGPGLSGSSMAGVAEWLITQGAAPDRIVLMPGHGGGPGTAASADVRAIWRRLAVLPSDPLMDDATVARWTAGRLGGAVRSVEDLSGGLWRSRRFPAPAHWPPVDPRSERRKLLVTLEDGSKWLARFAGLGASGERKFERARALADAGHGRPTPHLLHGFLLQPWLEGARTAGRLPAAAIVSRYLVARRGLRPAPGHGADTQALFDMIRINTREALGRDPSVRILNRLAPPHADPQVRRAIDGAFQPWKWLRDETGRWVKADALDHDGDHDLIGPQPEIWDRVAAALELGLAGPAFLAGSRSTADVDTDPAGHAFWAAAYLAFRLGAVSMARPSQDPAESRRSDALLAQIRGRLLRVAQGASPFSSGPLFRPGE